MYAEADGLNGSTKPDLSRANSNERAELSAQNALKEMPASAPTPMTELYSVSGFQELDTTGRAVQCWWVIIMNK